MYKLELDLPLANGTVVRPVWLNGTTLRALEDNLPLSESHLLYHLFRCVTFRHGTLCNSVRN